MDIITGISVVALASMLAILINDHTSFGGLMEESDDSFSLFARASTAPVLTNRGEEAGQLVGSGQSPKL